MVYRQRLTISDINYSRRASELGGIINFVDRRLPSLSRSGYPKFGTKLQREVSLGSLVTSSRSLQKRPTTEQRTPVSRYEQLTAAGGPQMVWYGMVNVDLYSAVITKVSNALDTLVSGEKPGFQTLSEGLVVLLCAEVVRQRVPDHGAVHSECSASDSG